MRLGLSVRRTALQLGFLVMYGLQGQVLEVLLETQNLFAPNPEPSKIYRERLPPGGHRASGTRWAETKGSENGALENSRHKVEEGEGLDSLGFEGRPRRVPEECGWDGTGLPSCLRTRHGIWMCARRGGGQSRISERLPLSRSCTQSP